jgi:hypothetical protein
MFAFIESQRNRASDTLGSPEQSLACRVNRETEVIRLDLQDNLP